MPYSYVNEMVRVFCSAFHICEKKATLRPIVAPLQTYTLFSLWLWLHVLPTLCLKGVGAGRSAGFLIRSMMRGIALCFFSCSYDIHSAVNYTCTHRNIVKWWVLSFSTTDLDRDWRPRRQWPLLHVEYFYWSCRYQIISTYSTSIWTEITKLITPCLHL